MTSQPKRHAGGCHCGKVRFTVDVDLDAELMTCNCSICGRTGSIMTFVPDAAFTLVSGQDALTDYQFGARRVHHLFCSTCGVRAFGRGTNGKGERVVMINARCVDDVDLGALRTRQFDGKSL